MDPSDSILGKLQPAVGWSRQQVAIIIKISYSPELHVPDTWQFGWFGHINHHSINFAAYTYLFVLVSVQYRILLV